VQGKLFSVNIQHRSTGKGRIFSAWANLVHHRKTRKMLLPTFIPARSQCFGASEACRLRDSDRWQGGPVRGWLGGGGRSPDVPVQTLIISLTPRKESALSWIISNSSPPFNQNESSKEPESQRLSPQVTGRSRVFCKRAQATELARHRRVTRGPPLRSQAAMPFPAAPRRWRPRSRCPWLRVG
jgi:hypothetical protein